MKKFSITLCTLMVALVASADPTGTISTANGSASGTIRWKNSAKEYVITTPKGASVTYAEDDVTDVNVDRPKNLDANIAKVKQGGAAVTSAISALETIAKEYAHLKYDREATRWLAEAYVKQNNAAKAIKACETVIRDNQEAAYMGPMAVAYWDALILDGKNKTKLDLLLEKAIASGDATAAASALLKRGDAVMARGSARANCEEALRDGYLRVILLYADPTSETYPEALSKAAKAFEGMGQSTVANRLREQLKADCPTSEWNRK